MPLEESLGIFNFAYKKHSLSSRRTFFEHDFEFKTVFWLAPLAPAQPRPENATLPQAKYDFLHDILLYTDPENITMLYMITIGFFVLF